MINYANQETQSMGNTQDDDGRRGGDCSVSVDIVRLNRNLSGSAGRERSSYREDVPVTVCVCSQGVVGISI